MRLKSALIAAMFSLAACNAAPPARDPAAPLSATETRLIEYAASDFKSHVAAADAAFRRVRAGVMRGEASTRNVLCGEFRTPDQLQWAPFAVVETDPYENWLGGAAAAQCAAPETTLDQRDLADALNQRYQALE